MLKNKKNSWIIFYPAGDAQVEGIIFAKSLGYKILCLDKNKKAKGKKYSDKFISINKKKEMIFFFKKIKSLNVVAVFSLFSDVGLEFVKAIKNQFKLCHNFKNYRLFENKLYLRNKIKYLSLNPNYSNLNNINEFYHYKKKFNKIVTKPAIGSASKNVFIFSDITDKKILLLKKILKNKTKVMVEEFIDGTEYTVDGLVINKRNAKIIMICKKERSVFNPAVARSVTAIQKDRDVVGKKLKIVVTKLVRQLGIYKGPFHAEFIVNKKKIFLIDFSPRSGGAIIGSKMATAHSGFDITKNFILLELNINRLKISKAKLKDHRIKLYWKFYFENQKKFFSQNKIINDKCIIYNINKNVGKKELSKLDDRSRDMAVLIK